MDQAHSLQRVFSERLFRIPDYQRGYAWEERQWRELFDDIEALPPGRDHYAGTLVLHRARGKFKTSDIMGHTYDLFDVVDGQQRLTTLILLIDAIAREMGKFAELRPRSEGLRTYYVATSDKAGQVLPKLTLNQDCHAFFMSHVVQGAGSVAGTRIRSHRLLGSGRLYFIERLQATETELGSRYPSYLESLAEKITQSLVVLIYSIGSETDAGVIFETMNNRGKPISEFEKVKNYLLYLSSKLDVGIEHSLPTEITSAWSSIFRLLMAADLSEVVNEDQLLRAHWLMSFNPQLNEWKGSESVKQRFSLTNSDYKDNHSRLLTDLREYVSSLCDSATAYSDVLSPDRSDAFASFAHDKQLRRRSSHAAAKLTRLGAIASFLPLLMAIRQSSPGDSESYLSALDVCEKFAFRVFAWSRKAAYTGRSMLFRLANELYTGKRDPETAFGQMRDSILGYCSDEQFAARFAAEGENWYEWHAIKYFLYEYEEHLARDAKQEAKIRWDWLANRTDTIEHILPQNPAVQSSWRRSFNPGDREKYTHDVGNLCLTLDFANSTYSNKAFPEKRGDLQVQPSYATSQLFCERQLATYSDWTPSTVEKRRESIRDWAVERWRVLPSRQTPNCGDVETELSVDRIRGLAVQRGVGALFDSILSIGEESKLKVTPHPWCVVFSPPAGRRKAVFTVWPKEGQLEIAIWPPKDYEKYAALKRQFGTVTWHYATPGNGTEVVMRLRSALTEDQSDTGLIDELEFESK